MKLIRARDKRHRHKHHARILARRRAQEQRVRDQRHAHDIRRQFYGLSRDLTGAGLSIVTKGELQSPFYHLIAANGRRSTERWPADTTAPTVSRNRLTPHKESPTLPPCKGHRRGRDRNREGETFPGKLPIYPLYCRGRPRNHFLLDLALWLR
ncbi:MAG: hypothetical protein ACRD50_10220 [Candidatus Acidiferrales bacterium]